MSTDPEPQPSPIPFARKTVLPYQGYLRTSAVTVQTCANPVDAQLIAGELETAGIDAYVLNQNANALGPYSAFCPVEVQVKQQDAERAREALARSRFDPLDVEPAETATEMTPEEGQPELVEAARFDQPRRLFEAAALLGASRIESFLPPLAPRGNRPKGSGPRYVLRVRETDLERAREVLEDAAAEEADEDDIRCPRCGSWRTYPMSRPFPGILPFLFGGARNEPREFECLRCRHRWFDQQHHT